MKGEKGLNLGDETRQCIEKHFEQGIPLTDLKGMRQATIERFQICMELLDLVEQDPTFQERAWLRHVKGRTTAQIARDVQMFDMILEYQMPKRKARAAYIVQRTSERLIKQGEQTGDWKPQHAGAKLIAEINRLGEEETINDGVGDTFIFQPVLVNVNEIDSSRKSLSEEERQRLMAKYKAVRDKTAELLKSKVEQRKEEMLDEITEAEELKDE